MADVKIVALMVTLMVIGFACGVLIGFAVWNTPAVAGDPGNMYAAPEVPVYDLSANGTTVNVSLGSEFIVSLLDNGASTGYTWDLTSSNGLDLLESKYIPPNITLIGEPGIREFRFKAAQTGPQGVHITLRRSWEPLTGDEQVFHLNVTVS